MSADVAVRLQRLFPNPAERAVIGEVFSDLPAEKGDRLLLLDDAALKIALEKRAARPVAGLGARPELVNSEHWAAANLPPLDVPLTQLKDAAQAAMLSKQKLPSAHLSSQNIDMLMQPNLFPAAGKLAAAVHTAATVDTTNCKSELEIAGWMDALLVHPMRACADAVAKGPVMYARNTGDVFTDASTSKKHSFDRARADLTLGLRNTPLARGEDKVQSVSHDTALQQVADKFMGAYNSRVYGSKITYHLCYTCCGRGIRFWAVLVPGQNVEGCQEVTGEGGAPIRCLRLTDTLVPSTSASQREQVIRLGLFILQVMAAQQAHVSLEFVLQKGRTRIEFFQNFVFKRVHQAEGDDAQLPDPAHMRVVYGLGATVPELVQLARPLLRGNPGLIEDRLSGRLRYQVKTELVGRALPVGYTFPSDQVQLVARCVLKALSRLHAAGWTHADLRPPNIVRHNDGQRYVVIDLEGALQRGTVPPAGVQRVAWGPNNEALQDGKFTAASDLWALGSMLRSCPPDYHRSPEALAFCDSLQQRPQAVYSDAAEALNDTFVKP